MRGLAALLAGLAACSDFTTTAGGVARLDVEIPVPTEVEVDQTISLKATPRDENGDPIDVPVFWRGLDTTLTVDSVTGDITGRTAGRNGRVVARAVDLYSNEITFAVLARADLLTREADSAITVAAGATTSEELTVRLTVGDPPVAVSGRRVTFEVVAPTFPTAADRTVEFDGGVLVLSRTTGVTGSPLAVTLRRRSGTVQPDTAIVKVSVYRPGGSTVPGSGLLFYVLFED